MVILDTDDPTAETCVYDIEEPKLRNLGWLGDADPDRKPFMDSGLVCCCSFY